MEKYTQKQLRALIHSGAAIDLSARTSNADYSALMADEGCLHQIGYSAGLYGCNGKLFLGDKSGRLYAIPSNCTAIYVY